MEIIVDLNNICTADEFYDALGAQIELPEYFGYNLDALHDVLGEITKETNIRIINTDTVGATMPRFLRGLKRLAEDIHKENEKISMQVE